MKKQWITPTYPQILWAVQQIDTISFIDITKTVHDDVEKYINSMWIGAKGNLTPQYKLPLSLYHNTKSYTIVETERHTPYYKDREECLRSWEI